MAVRQATPYMLMLGPPQFRRWLLDRVPVARVQRFKELVDTLWARSTEILAASRRRVEKARAEGVEDADTKNLVSVLRESPVSTCVCGLSRC